MKQSDIIIRSIFRHIDKFYRPEEYPALNLQWKEWEKTRPLNGKRILVATPLFTNTLIQYIPLLAAGAEITVATNDKASLYDSSVVALLEEWGLPHVHNAVSGQYDCVLDCGGVHAMMDPESGFAELTRSGYYHYAGQKKPVILVDDSRTKAIETCLGTGDGFLRAMKQIGYTDFNRKKVVVFGYGKVGRGIVFYLLREGAEITVIDEPETSVPDHVRLVSRYDFPALGEAIKVAWCIVTATGVRNAMVGNGAAEILKNTDQLIAAMGVENEWGDTLPPDRILFRGRALNFLLDEPTRLRYIDPTMALLNAAALELTAKKLPAGIQKIDPAVEYHWRQAVEQNGLIADDLRECGL